MKARYQYRFYPTDQQQQSLARLFGCVRVVYNDALAICKQSESVAGERTRSTKKPKSTELQKIVITQAKKTEARAWLSEVSNIPLQQSVADLEIAFKNFFDSCKGKRKGRKVGYPKFKKRTNSQSARFRIGGFSIKIDLSVRSVLCLNCGTEHDRDLNASVNIEMVGTGHRHDLKCTQRQSKTTSVASVNEA
jgi:putative transposase